jgi:hypothetical protein
MWWKKMGHLKSWILEFCFVIDNSGRAYSAIMVAIVAPTAIFAAGAWFIADIGVSTPYAPVVATVTHSLAKVLLGLTIVMRVKCLFVAAGQYQKAKVRLGLECGAPGRRH